MSATKSNPATPQPAHPTFFDIRSPQKSLLIEREIVTIIPAQLMVRILSDLEGDMIRMLLGAALALALTNTAVAQAREPEAVIRIVDVGPGLCVVASFPDGYDLLYDAGHWHGSGCREAVRDMVQDDRIELVILSHTDADHLGELPDILGDKRVGVMLHTGGTRTTATWREAVAAMGSEVADGATILSLSTWPLSPGTEFKLGDATVTFVFGLSTWDHALSEGRLNQGEQYNAVSITVRVSYGGYSVLLTGDTIGRRLNDGDEACKDAEAFMVRNQASVPLRSDVLVAAHHGGNNGSASCFLEAVSPTWVIFSAGHDHHHPRQETAARVLAAGVSRDRILRTDRGDDEGGREWAHGRQPGCRDPRGDDDIEIRIRPGQDLQIGYLTPDEGC